jgi:hypothetical protein
MNDLIQQYINYYDSLKFDRIKLDALIKKHTGIELLFKISNLLDKEVDNDLKKFEDSREWITGKPE